MTAKTMRAQKEITDAIDRAVLDKSIERWRLIHILKDVAGDLEGLIDSLYDDQRREDEREASSE